MTINDGVFEVHVAAMWEKKNYQNAGVRFWFPEG